jgi:hypothetical protein
VNGFVVGVFEPFKIAMLAGWRTRVSLSAPAAKVLLFILSDISMRVASKVRHWFANSSVDTVLDHEESSAPLSSAALFADGM